MPLVGVISPDCPPPFLEGLTGDTERGWTGLLPERDRDALEGLGDAWPEADEAGLGEAGWWSARFGPWHGLWHAAPRGWSPMPGHGHQDCGGFELHYRNEPLFVDPGRGAYGETGEAALYRSGAVHNTLLVDGLDPYPANKPYYDEEFRRRFGGPPPEVTRFEDGIGLTHHGYGRLGHVGAVTRRWRFSGRDFTIADRVEGRTGVRAITRVLVTPHAADLDEGAVTIQREGAAWRVRFDGECSLRPLTHWRAYGQGTPATAIEITVTADLPWEGTLTVEAV
ncbi:MAG: heparinase II/III-family protein [Proteobacteria bacterium]|nr:heparinase II/III-family protein [Pseudomonadota bacterium]